MFKRLFYDDWMATIPIIAFLVTFIGFLIFTTRAILMQREMADEISRLPLDDPSTTESEIDHV